MFELKTESTLGPRPIPYNNVPLISGNIHSISLSQRAVSAGLADSTKTSSGAGILRFNQFCDLMGVAETLRMPADETLIIGFVGHHMGSKSGSCIKSWLSAIQAWHALAGAPWPTDSKLLKLARKGARRDSSQTATTKSYHFSTSSRFILCYRSLQFFSLRCMGSRVCCFLGLS
ncbi:hypothetical protein FB446DRAFT_517515 [Lentinula raphanica]|nr:hypothetical protein FB446DRAFT_517515 [Lentinula raphanica]